MNDAMRTDESAAYMLFASKPLRTGLSTYLANNHLSVTFLMHVSANLFGAHPWAIRLPTLLAGVGLVPAIYFTGRRLYSKEAAILAAALVASSSALIEYATNARGYTLIALIFVLLLGLQPSLLRSDRLLPWFLYAALITIGFYTIPVMLFSFGVLALWLLLSCLTDSDVDRMRFLTRLTVFTVGAAASTLLLYLPVFINSGVDVVFSDPFVQSVSARAFRSGLPLLAGDVWAYWNRGLPLLVAIALACGFVLAVLMHKRLASHRVLIAFASVLWIGPHLWLQRVLPYTRVWLFLLPVYLLVAAAGLSWGLTRFWHRRRGWTPIIAALATAGLISFVASTHTIERSRDPGRLWEGDAIVDFLSGYLRPGDRVFAKTPARNPLDYYFARKDLPSSYLEWPIRRTSRLIVVVDEWEHQTLTSVLSQTRAFAMSEGSPGVTGFGPPRTLRRYPRAVLYELNASANGSVTNSCSRGPRERSFAEQRTRPTRR